MNAYFHNLTYLNPDSVLPIFLGVLLFGMIVWNVAQTSQLVDLETKNDDLREENEALWADLSTAVKKIPKRDTKGKFQKK